MLLYTRQGLQLSSLALTARYVPLSSTILKLEKKDPFFDKAVLCLGQSKSGKRAGAGQMVVVESQLAIQWLRTACARVHKSERLLWGESFWH